MKIMKIEIGHISIPLKRKFKTALRVVDSVEDIVVKITTDTGNVGYGEAPPTGVITGDTKGSIIAAIKDHIEPSILGIDIENFEELIERLNKCVAKNMSAKAAVDIALYDLYGQLYKAPLYKLLGGYRKQVTTDITISVNSPQQMAKDSVEAVKLGYKTLKVKVGIDSRIDIERLKEIRKAVGFGVDIRIDANQGWKPKEAVYALRKMEDDGLNIEFVEQPVVAHDIDGLKFVADNITIPVMADESVFSPKDALRIMQGRACDLINIKLMKTGGINGAIKICNLAEIYEIECMMGCMLESKISVTAAASLAAAKKVITKIDLDGPILCKEDPIKGGAVFKHSIINFADEPGLGIKDVPMSK